MNENDIVIVAAKRTPIGSFLGSLSSLSVVELGATASKAAISQAGIQASDIDSVITGCVLQAGVGQAPARQAAIAAGIPTSCPTVTINRICGSGLQAVILAHDSIRANSATIVLSSGMESMSKAPYLLAQARTGYRFGHGELIDHMQRDGLEDAYQSKAMGCFAEATANAYQLSREQQDTFAAQSMQRALTAQQNGLFNEEITPITLQERTGERVVAVDESPHADKLLKISRLKPAFQAEGTVTAGNSSSIADGAASVVLMSFKEAKQRGLKPLAKLIAHASHAQDPEWFTTAPVEAIKRVLNKANWSVADVDLFEINEAFAVVPMVAIQSLGLNPDKVNIHGGACALGHPIGASGTRILVTLIYALKQQNKSKGIASLCIGGGEATALAIEVMHD